MIFNHTIEALKGKPTAELRVIFRRASEATAQPSQLTATAANTLCLQVKLALSLRR